MESQYKCTGLNLSKFDIVDCDRLFPAFRINIDGLRSIKYQEVEDLLSSSAGFNLSEGM